MGSCCVPWTLKALKKERERENEQFIAKAVAIMSINKVVLDMSVNKQVIIILITCMVYEIQQENIQQRTILNHNLTEERVMNFTENGFSALFKNITCRILGASYKTENLVYRRDFENIKAL